MMGGLFKRSSLNVCSKCYKEYLRSFSNYSVSLECATGTLLKTPANLVFRGRALERTFSSTRLSSTSFASRSTSSLLTPALLKHNPSRLSSLYFSYGSRSLLESREGFFSRANLSLVQCYSTEGTSGSNPLPPRKSKTTENSMKSPISWRNLVIIAVVGGVLLVGMQYVKQEKEEARRKTQNKKIGKARLGGEWTLTDHHGNQRSSWDFRGQWILIYFGFTNCPDICPEEIEKIVSVIEKTDADPELPKIQPILITVDPVRDTPAALKEYCAEFSPRLIGFSGSEEQIDAATRAYRVYYSAGPKDEDNDYIVDHSIISYLVNPEGEFTEYFGQNKKVDEIYSSAKLHILSYMKKKAKQ